MPTTMTSLAQGMAGPRHPVGPGLRLTKLFAVFKTDGEGGRGTGAQQESHIFLSLGLGPCPCLCVWELWGDCAGVWSWGCHLWEETCLVLSMVPG